jgi:predicted DsbA family dithiol-disulfide isomerase
MSAAADRFRFDVEWKAFMLRRELPAEGVVKEEYMASRYGSVEAYRNNLPGMTQTFASEGIVFNPEGQRTGSSLASHRIMAFARKQNKQDEMAEELFKRYITDRQWIGDSSVCVDAAAAVGLEKGAASAFMSEPTAGLAEVEEDLALGRQYQVSGVPFFVINDRYSLSGAQNPAAFLEVFEKSSSL